MSRKQSKPAPEISRVDVWAERIAGWPRLARILVCGGVALLAVLFTAQVMSALVGAAVLQDYAAVNGVIIVSTLAGMAAYGAGWWLLVGFDRPSPPPNRRSVYFLLVALLLTAALIVWTLFRLFVAFLPPELPF